jgi:hypothetical protein
MAYYLPLILYHCFMRLYENEEDANQKIDIGIVSV